ncbi:lysozyme g-like [Centropristis striata]|uniref:lysozyme g-like n=1 Tax=Centropristis striata TaxID=184440 RepID=UPI0027DEF501|nr:lysozyme g-like [Centropristis striata]
MSYGNIMAVHTTGASTGGVRRSHAMAKDDADSIEKYRSKINKVGAQYGIAPALIAAIISRESSGGRTLSNGWGDYDSSRRAYNGWGLMQVDVNPNGGRHTARGAWDSEEHLRQGTDILVYFIGRIRNKFPRWSTEQQLKGGIAAYNQGDGNVHSYENVDENTTHGDYSNDVVARAQWYAKNKGF